MGVNGCHKNSICVLACVLIPWKITCGWPHLMYSHVLFRAVDFWCRSGHQVRLIPQVTASRRQMLWTAWPSSRGPKVKPLLPFVMHERRYGSAPFLQPQQGSAPRPHWCRDTYPFLFSFHFASDFLRGRDWRGVVEYGKRCAAGRKYDS